MSAQTTSGSTQFLTKMGIIGELLRFLWKVSTFLAEVMDERRP